MQLKNDFYQIESERNTEKGFLYQLKLNASHFIYEAHFPSHPITPGVCVVQIALELLSQQLQKRLEITKVNNLKFVSILSPVDTPEVVYDFQNVKEDEESQIKSQVIVRFNDIV